MPKRSIPISLVGPDFPFLYRDRQRISSDTADGGSGFSVPLLLFAENVMPIKRGLLSTANADIIEGPTPPVADFDQAIVVRDSLENNSLVVPAKGKNYVLDVTTGTWTSTLPFTPTHKLVTRGYVQGRTFIFYEKHKLFEYDGPGNTLIDRTGTLVLPAGVTVANIRGIGAASNYLLLFSELGIYWSDPTDPLNFNVALNNGSGYQTPQDVRGQISCILPVSGGAIIYTVRNAVAATFTNNAATPFLFRGITNSGGVASYEQVAYDADERYQFVWGSGGLQKVSLQLAEGIFPEVTDFLTSSILETFNPATRLVDTIALPTFLSAKLTYVAQRYLVISYGPSAGVYDYALIFDTILQRWGKVKVQHVDAFTYPYPNIAGDLEYDELNTSFSELGDTTIAELGVGILSTSPPKRSIAFLRDSGAISILSIDYRARTNGAVAIFGHVQNLAGKMTTLHSVELDGKLGEPTIWVTYSLNGRTPTATLEYPSFEGVSDFKKYLGDTVGKTLQVVLQGVFNLTNMSVEVARHGRS